MHKKVKVWFLVTLILSEVALGGYHYLTVDIPFVFYVIFSIFLFVFLGMVFSSFIYHPLATKAIKKNVSSEIGDYILVKHLKGFDSVFDTSGVMLVLSEDNKLYRVDIKKTEVTKAIKLDSIVSTSL